MVTHMYRARGYQIELERLLRIENFVTCTPFAPPAAPVGLIWWHFYLSFILGLLVIVSVLKS